MRRYIKIGMFVALLLILFVAGMAIAQSAKTSELDVRFPVATQWLKQNNLSITTSPDHAISDGYILVAGEAFPPLTERTKGQKQLMAQRIATFVATRQLAKMVKKVIVMGGKNEGFAEEAVKEAVKEAKVVYKDYNEQEETALVLMKIELFLIRGLDR